MLVECSSILLSSILLGESIDNKEGLSFDLGVGISSIDYKTEKLTSTLLDTKVSYGLNQKFVLYSEALFSSESSSLLIGGKYFMKNINGIPYIIGALGKSSTELYNLKESNSFGKTYKVGLGYELNDWFIEGSYLQSNSKNVNDFNSFNLLFGKNFYSIF
jgi:long-subunit fatty acid transport protein